MMEAKQTKQAKEAKEAKEAMEVKEAKNIHETKKAKGTKTTKECPFSGPGLFEEGQSQGGLCQRLPLRKTKGPRVF